jgi:predicted Zn-dependent peptidase
MKKPTLKKLDNGLSILVIPNQNPSVTVMSLIHTGARNETRSNNGISHFLEHMCFKGTTNQSGKEIMRYLDGLGAETNAFTSHELTGYYVKSITKHWKKTLATVADIYLNAAFPEVEMQKEKGVILGEISMYEDMPIQHVHQLFQGLVYGDQPAGWSVLGPRENIKKMTQADFQKYHNDNYTADNTTIVVSGNVVPAEIIQEVKRQFATIGNGKDVPAKKTKRQQTEPQLLIENKITDQTHLVFGYSTVGYNNADTRALKVLASVLGGGMSSRLFERLREDMGVGYYVHTNSSHQNDCGILQTSCGVDSQRVAEVIAALQEEYIRCTTELVPEIELKKTKEYIIGNFQMGLESSDDQAYYHGSRNVFGFDLLSPTQYAKEIKSITPADIKRVAKKYFKLKSLNIGMIGPHTNKQKKSFLKNI